MEHHGTCSGMLDIMAQADDFFHAFVDVITSHREIAEEDLVEPVDYDERTMKVRMRGRLIPAKYRTVTVSISVTPKEDPDACQVVWSVQFEKNSLNTMGNRVVTWLKGIELILP